MARTNHMLSWIFSTQLKSAVHHQHAVRGGKGSSTTRIPNRFSCRKSYTSSVVSCGLSAQTHNVHMYIYVCINVCMLMGTAGLSWCRFSCTRTNLVCVLCQTPSSHRVPRAGDVIHPVLRLVRVRFARLAAVHTCTHAREIFEVQT